MHPAILSRSGCDAARLRSCRRTLYAMRLLTALTALTATAGPALAQLVSERPDSVAGATSAGPGAAAPRPRVGLVLGGGGARGAAHVGVLEVLDRLNVGVDCVAGTSMGALVAGAFAAGRSPASMREELARAEWGDMFIDDPDYTELNVRNKRTLRRVLPGTELGYTARGVMSPPGVVSGQKIKLFFNRLVFAEQGEPMIENLPLPLSIVATDIGNGERVVLRSGSLSQAMRASMSVPGLMAPLDWRGRKLVDGGLVDNLPIREARELCEADVVIAVNVGSPLLAPEDVGSLLSVSAQVVGILTEQNVTQSLATLKPQDIYIQPDLKGITAADFDKHAETAERGRLAAEAVAERLRALSLPPERHAAWKAGIERRPGTPPRIDEIEVALPGWGAATLVSRYLRQATGDPLDVAALQRDLGRVYGDGLYQSVDYALSVRGDRNVLRVTPVEKSWGPDYLRFGLGLNNTLRSGSTFSLRAAYQKTRLNALGGEAIFTGEVGSTFGGAVDVYQPLDAGQRSFVEGSLYHQRTSLGYFANDLRLGLFRVGQRGYELALGANAGLLGRVRLGVAGSIKRYDLDTGVPIFPVGPHRVQGWFADIDLDQLDGAFFPSSGWQARLGWFDSTREPYTRWTADGRAATKLGPWVLLGRVSASGSPSGRLPFYDAAQLGGFLNLSGFAVGQLVGDSMRYLQLRGERIIGRMPLGLRGDLRVGLSLEVGRMGLRYSEPFRPGWLDSAALYFGGLTPFGPAFVAWGRSSSGSSNAYLFIGTP